MPCFPAGSHKLPDQLNKPFKQESSRTQTILANVNRIGIKTNIAFNNKEHNNN